MAAGVFSLMLFSFYFFSGNAEAATSYNNAREFYESTGASGAHAEVYQGNIYYATSARLASASSNLKYGTVGYDITLSGNGQSVSFSVKRNGDGSMQEVPGSRVDYRGYEYNLYCIESAKLFQLAQASNEAAAEVVLKSSQISVRIDAIMTTKRNGTSHGGVTEDGRGGLHEWGSVYHLRNASELAAMRRIFGGHTFTSFYDITLPLSNYAMSIRYNVQGGSVGNGYTVNGGVLSKNGSPTTTQARLMESFQLVNPGAVALSKEGHHLEQGKEWLYGNRGYSAGTSYMPKDLSPDAGVRDVNIYMYANWKVNTYTVRYHANGGSGYMQDAKFNYGAAVPLPAPGFTRQGYHLRPGKEWNTRADGSGISYSSGQIIESLTAENGKVILLYAQWEPDIFSVTTDKQGGTGGTDVFYEKYGVGWFSDPECENQISVIAIPKKTGHIFCSYDTGLYGSGTVAVGETGRILVPSHYFLWNAYIYANWEPKRFTITFDRQGGVGGTDSATATYGEELPRAEAPVRSGYSFRGYYSKANGQGELYYNEQMAGNTKYVVDKDMTLYAYWEDDSRPEVTLTADISAWTNRKITLTADARDYGTGLHSVTIYCKDQVVAEKTGLNGSIQEKLVFVNDTEGAVNYRAVAVDEKGNRAEAFRTVYYDITPPKGVVSSENYDGFSMELTVEHVTDLKLP